MIFSQHIVLSVKLVIDSKDFSDYFDNFFASITVNIFLWYQNEFLLILHW